MNQPLVALASPDPSLTQAQSRHTQSEFVTFLAQGPRDALVAVSLRPVLSPRWYRRKSLSQHLSRCVAAPLQAMLGPLNSATDGSWFLRHYLAILPDVDRRVVHARDRVPRRTAASPSTWFAPSASCLYIPAARASAHDRADEGGTDASRVLRASVCWANLLALLFCS